MPVDNNQISAHVRTYIEDWLRRVEREEGVRILYSAESGSRAWGFASPASDYDVRFIYAHGRDWYTGLTDGRDVIERPLDAELVDLAGWDVKKALRLLLKSNPAFYEWLVSPIVYLDDGRFRQAAKALFERAAEHWALAHHYHSIAAGQWKREIDGRDDVKLKKYFYVVRPLLSLQWVIANKSMPPMNLHDLMAATEMPAGVRAAVVELYELKKSTPELGRRPRLAVIDDWALERMAALQPAQMIIKAPDVANCLEEANALFRGTVGL